MRVRLTNRLGLPEPIVEAVANDPYSSGDSDYTATSLLQPPKAAALLKQYQPTEDAADRLYALQGQIIHLLLERAGKALACQGYVVEKRFKTTYAVGGRIFRVSAQVDLFDPVKAVISDYKYTSVGSLKYGLKEDHRLQLNLQAELIRREGFKVDSAEVVLLLRDWSAERDYEGYPKEPVVKVKVPLMSSEEINAWVVERIKAHEAAKVTLPLCTASERWSRPTFAVMKDASDKKAVRVFDTRSEAESYIAAKGSPFVIVERPGKSIRCLRYCPVRDICSQAKEFRPTIEVDGDGLIKIT
jgi:hypothetical protein